MVIKSDLVALNFVDGYILLCPVHSLLAISLCSRLMPLCLWT